jgi:hypothetical protein
MQVETSLIQSLATLSAQMQHITTILNYYGLDTGMAFASSATPTVIPHNPPTQDPLQSKVMLPQAAVSPPLLDADTPLFVKS